MKKSAILTLADGTRFHGTSIGAEGEAVGEVVFNTSMTGYQEILTDPSYAKQLVTLTYPHIGNTGCNAEDGESSKVWAEALIIRDLPLLESSWRSEESLSAFLRRHGVVAIADIDTRKLTRILREKGAQNGSLIAGDAVNEQRGLSLAKAFGGLKGMDLARVVTGSVEGAWQGSVWSREQGHVDKSYGDDAPLVIAYDFGIKANILRCLVDRGCRVEVVRAETSASEVLAKNPDGIFLSNGPGDPEPCTYAIEAIAVFLEKKIPVFGICLGHQLLALASGAKTQKMKFGHHGANHPVQCVKTGRVMITSQNHGFTVDELSLPNNLAVTHRSLFDGTLQGIKRTDCPAISFQGHPEASPGPHDAGGLFDEFMVLMARNRS